VVRVAAAKRKLNRAVAKSTRLALNARELFAVVDDQVVAGVLAKGHEEIEASSTQRAHDCEGRTVADDLRVFHLERMRASSDERVQNRQHQGGYDMAAPE
jgi:hypothetical protein